MNQTLVLIDKAIYQPITVLPEKVVREITVESPVRRQRRSLLVSVLLFPFRLLGLIVILAILYALI